MGRCSHRQTSRASLPVHGGCDDNTLSFVAGALCVSGIPHFARSTNSGHRVFRCFYCDPLGARAKSCLMWVCACVRVRQSLRRPQRTIVLQFLRSRNRRAIKMWDWSKNPADRFLSVSHSFTLSLFLSVALLFPCNIIPNLRQQQSSLGQRKEC